MNAIQILHDHEPPASGPDLRDRNELQTLKRGLQALTFLNDGPTTLAHLARRLGVPRPNAYRILQTLISDGYCERVFNSRLYMVSPKVRTLAAGLGEGELLTSVAAQVVEALGVEVKWPVALATPNGGEMLVRLTTDRSTSLALAKINPGYRAPMLLTTTGVLYLAFSPPELLEDIIDTSLRGRDLKQFFHNREHLEQVIQESREQGYMILDSRYAEGCIGVPLMQDGRPLGGLVMRYIRSAMPRARVISEYLPKLRAAADEVMARYAASGAAAGLTHRSCADAGAQTSSAGDDI